MNEKEKALADLEVIKTMINRTKEAIDPAAPIIIMWGIMVVIGNYATYFFLQNALHEYIGFIWLGVVVTGVVSSSIMGYRIGNRRSYLAVNKYASRKLALIWTIIVPVGVIWSTIGPYYDIIPVEFLSLFWALLYSIGIYITGIFYSREYIYGGIIILTGTVLSVLFYEYHNLIIGTFMGAGTIYPGVVANNRFKKMLREHNEG